LNKYLKDLNAPAAIAIADVVRKLESDGARISKMQTGEPCFDTPEYIKAAALEALNAGHTHYSYSQGLPLLREGISRYYHKLYGTDINANDIVISNGGVNAIYCVMLSLLNRGDEVIIFDPSWPQYANIAIMAGAKVKRVSTKNSNFRITPELLQKNITSKTKLIIINNPCNPTGVVYDNRLMNKLLKIANATDAYLLFDEVYHDNVYAEGFQSILANSGFKKNKDRIIYINSFSKSFAMTGWRIGYAILPNSLVPFCLKMSQNSFTNVNTFVQYAAVAAIEQRNSNIVSFDAMNKLYRKRWLELETLFESLKIETTKPGGAFYHFIPVNKDGMVFSKWLLNTHKIAVVPGIAYGPDFSKFIRVSFSVDAFSYDYFLKTLSDKTNRIFEK
jgi:aspartate aminotransferase